MDWTQWWTSADLFFTITLALTLLVMLYAMALMSRQLRLLQYQVSVIENDLKLMGEELKMLAARERPDPDKIKPVEADL